MAEKEPSSGTEDDPDADSSSSQTPDLWMLRWLQLHRQRLLDGMQNVVPIILDYLADKGKFDPLRSDVYQEIMLDTTAPLQKARKLLDRLAIATQPPAVFWSFQHAIRQDRLQTEAVHGLAVSDKEMREFRERVNDTSLPEKLNLLSCRSVLKAREELQKFYRSRDKLLMNAGLSKGKTMALDKILVNLCLLSSEEVKRRSKSRRLALIKTRSVHSTSSPRFCRAGPHLSVWRKFSRQKMMAKKLRTKLWPREVQDAENRCASHAIAVRVGPWKALEAVRSSVLS